MIIDTLANAGRYYSVHSRIREAFQYLMDTDLAAIAPGKYPIDGDNMFAIVQEYETLDMAGEQMESHKKYIDVQYMIEGEELVGHALLGNQAISRAYKEIDDYIQYEDSPTFFTKMEAGTFMVFFSTDLHAPCIRIKEPQRVKKVVVKVASFG